MTTAQRQAVPLRGIQAFEAVGRLGGITAAARELGVSAGAISQQIRKIEDFLGVTLVERQGQRMALTTLGRQYHAGVSLGFKQLAQAEQLLRHTRNDAGFVLSALSSVATKWIGRLIFDWHALHPAANIHLIGRDGEPRLGHDGVDFRITYGLAAAQQHDHFTELFRDWVTPACAPSFAGGTGPVTVAAILRQPLLTVTWERHHGTFPSWQSFAQEAGRTLAPTPGPSFTLSSSAIDAAVARRGVVLAQLSMVVQEVETGALVLPVTDRLPLEESYYLAWDRSALQKPFGPQFRDWLVGVGRAQGRLSAGRGAVGQGRPGPGPEPQNF